MRLTVITEFFDRQEDKRIEAGTQIDRPEPRASQLIAAGVVKQDPDEEEHSVEVPKKNNRVKKQA